MLADLGKQSGADKEYRQALNIQEKLAAEFPNERDHREELAATHNSLGKLLLSVGKRSEAEGEFRQAVIVQDNLADDFPDVRECRQYVAKYHHNLGILRG